MPGRLVRRRPARVRVRRQERDARDGHTDSSGRQRATRHFQAASLFLRIHPRRCAALPPAPLEGGVDPDGVQARGAPRVVGSQGQGREQRRPSRRERRRARAHRGCSGAAAVDVARRRHPPRRQGRRRPAAVLARDRRAEGAERVGLRRPHGLDLREPRATSHRHRVRRLVRNGTAVRQPSLRGHRRHASHPRRQDQARGRLTVPRRRPQGRREAARRLRAAVQPEREGNAPPLRAHVQGRGRHAEEDDRRPRDARLPPAHRHPAQDQGRTLPRGQGRRVGQCSRRRRGRRPRGMAAGRGAR